ncbi:MAG: NAD(P)/FAD-dependent oxidoreductase [Promethearchaeota archaeon]
MDADVVVVGAGPVGGLAARQLARKGLSVLLLEEHNKIGYPVHCAGLIGITGLHENGVYPDQNVTITKVRRSILYAPSGSKLVFGKGAPHAYVVHRDLLDQQIVREAEEAGAKLLLGTRVINCQREQTGVRLTVRQGNSTREYQAQVVVNAEGISARLSRQNGLPGPRRPFILRALQYEVTNVSIPANTVHLFFDNSIACHFFAWIIPLKENQARIGLATSNRNARHALDRFLTRTSLLKGASVEKRFGGLVYTGGPPNKTVVERFVAVGDAVGQTKATTGGGVVSGGGCAIIAAKHVQQALQTGKYDHKELVRYERHWKRIWGRQLYQMSLLRRLINSLSNKELDRLFLSLQGSHVRKLVETKGDIDYQGRLITAALTSPSLIKTLLRLILSKARYLPKILWP